MSLRRTQAPQGHEFVVAASHLILRLRQPSQARITGGMLDEPGHVAKSDTKNLTLEALVTIVLIDKDIVWFGC